MTNRRISLYIVILISLITGMAGILGNIAVDALPPAWVEYKWVAWPLFGLATIAGIVLLIIQFRVERNQSTEGRNQTEALTTTETQVQDIETIYNQAELENRKIALGQQPLRMPLEWGKLRELAKQITKQNMARAAAKYCHKLYVPRADLQITFEDFLASDKVGFVLLGKSGSGKSNFLLAMGEDRDKSRPEQCWLLYDGSSANPMFSVSNMLASDFQNHLPGGPFINVIQEISRIPDIDNRKVILCFDAINENSQPTLLLRQIDDFVRKANWRWLKVVITSRPEAWHLLSSSFYAWTEAYYQPVEHSSIDEEELFQSAELLPFARDELAVAYENYKTVYKLQAPYSDYQDKEAILAILEDPLVLRMEAQINEGGSIPTNIKLRSVVPDYIEFLTKKRKGANVLTEEDLRFLRDDLMPLMVGEEPYLNKITAARLQQADLNRPPGQKLSDRVLKRGIRRSSAQPYTSLVDAEILAHSDLGETFEISFAFERYWDYFAGEHLLSQYKKISGATKQATFIIRLVELTHSQPYMVGPVHRLLIQALDAEAGDVLLRIASNPNPDCQDLIASVLLEAYPDNPDLVRSLLERLQMGWRHQRITPGEENRVLVAVEVAGGIGNTEILLSALRSRHETVRDRAVIATYKLWCKNRATGNDVLESMVGQVGLRTLLFNTQMIQSSVALSVLIFFNHFEDEDKCWQVVLDSWRPRLRRFFLYNPGSVGESRFTQWFRNLVLAVLIRITLTLLRSIPSRYSVISMPELRAFYRLEQPIKDLALEITTYLEPGEHDLISLRELLKGLFIAQSGGQLVNNMLLKLLIDFVLVANGEKHTEEVLDIAQELMYRELNRPGETKRVMWDKSWVYAALGWLSHLDMKALQDYTQYVRHCYQDIDLWVGSVGTYAYLGYSDYARVYNRMTDDLDVPALQELLYWAINTKNYQKALDLMEELVYLASSNLWTIAWNTLKPILSQVARNDKAPGKSVDLATVKDKTIEILAIAHARNPDAVRGSLLKMSDQLPAAFIEQVEVRKVPERVAGGLLKGGLGTWGQFEVTQGFSGAGRPYLVNIFRAGCQAKNLSQFLTVVAGTAINLLLGAPVFSIVVEADS